MTDQAGFTAALETLLRQILAAPDGRLAACQRLSGGANLESWLLGWQSATGQSRFVLRRSPSAAWSASRALSLADEAALVGAMHAAGVCAPQPIYVLTAEDALGDGYIMAHVTGSADPGQILTAPHQALLSDVARELAAIHAVPVSEIPVRLPVMDVASAIDQLRASFEAFGADRPVIALALKWCIDHAPPPLAAGEWAIVHGDYRLGNLLVDDGRLSAVLDWELAHLGDYHEDLAYGCMTVWRFSAVDRPAFGLGDLQDFFAAYRAAGGRVVDPARFRYWLIYRTLWWAIGCLQMGGHWRSGADSSIERAVISRRTAEQELDLLLLLEEDLPKELRDAARIAVTDGGAPTPKGEVTGDELLGAVSDWLIANVRAKAEGRDKFMAAVAVNALAIARREAAMRATWADAPLAADLLAGRCDLHSDKLLARLRQRTFDKCRQDMPKYPGLTLARTRWGR
ncbi:MAG: phosphotransferase family protein [Sphingomonadaceae bacterium]|nr:phosphotransferase family protein [Sphingomonadaceae bacterium]